MRAKTARILFWDVKVSGITLSICGRTALKLTYYNRLCQAGLQTFQKQGGQKGHIPHQLMYQAARRYLKRLSSSSRK